MNNSHIFICFAAEDRYTIATYSISSKKLWFKNMV